MKIEFIEFLRHLRARTRPFFAAQARLMMGNIVPLVVKRPADSYAGKWVLRRAQIGRERVEDALGPTIILFSKDRYILKNGNTVERGHVTVDLRKKPATMDLEAEQGPNAGRKQLAIFEVSADRMKLSYSLADAQRPSSFFSGQFWHLLSAEYVRVANL